jgi:hypothetical protein
LIVWRSCRRDTGGIKTTHAFKDFDGYPVYVADLKAIIESKKTLGRKKMRRYSIYWRKPLKKKKTEREIERTGSPGTDPAPPG